MGKISTIAVLKIRTSRERREYAFVPFAGVYSLTSIMIIKIITVIVASLMLARVGSKLKRKEITLNEAITWGLMWFVGGLVVLFPQVADQVVASIGLQSTTGIDLVMYVAVVVAFYLIFRLFVRVESIDQNITKLVRHLALDEEGKEKEKRN